MLDSIDGTRKHEMFTAMHKSCNWAIIRMDRQSRISIFNIERRENNRTRKRSENVFDQWEREVIIWQQRIKSARIQANATNLRIDLTSNRIFLGSSRKWIVEFATRRGRNNYTFRFPFLNLEINEMTEGFRNAILANKLGFFHGDRQGGLGGEIGEGA